MEVAMKALRYDILIENIKKLPLDDKEELKTMIENYIIEERRSKIFSNYQESKKEESNLNFTSNIDELKGMV